MFSPQKAAKTKNPAEAGFFTEHQNYLILASL